MTADEIAALRAENALLLAENLDLTDRLNAAGEAARPFVRYAAGLSEDNDYVALTPEIMSLDPDEEDEAYTDGAPTVGDCRALGVALGVLGDPAACATPRSAKWPRVRRDFLKAHPGCAGCGTDNDLEVHHVLPFHLHPDRELDPDNLMALCRPCHYVLGHRNSWHSHEPECRAVVAGHRERVDARPGREDGD